VAYHKKMNSDSKKIRLIMHLRSMGIINTDVLSAIERIPREKFVPDELIDKAYDDMALPIGRGQTISQPYVVAKMTESLEVNDRHKVLEVGTGSGYQAAILTKLCRRLYTIERHEPLLYAAEEKFDDLKIRNVTAKVGDGMKGWIEQKPFDRIMITAAAFKGPPKSLIEQLAESGVMIAPVDDGEGKQHLVRYIKTNNGIVAENLFPVRFVPLLPDVVLIEEDENINTGHEARL
jgi:protein-L-isoaspartate(D-aspartate) O-methyltransferase